MFQFAVLDMAAKSNHSLRATSISHLYAAGVPEKLYNSGTVRAPEQRGSIIIQVYERKSEQQEKAMSDL